MDAHQFDAFTRAVSRPRRVVAGGLLGLVLAPFAVTAKRRKRKKKKKAPCKAPNIACGKNLCCGSTQQCVSEQCQDVSPCGVPACAGYTNPAQAGRRVRLPGDRHRLQPLFRATGVRRAWPMWRQRRVLRRLRLHGHVLRRQADLRPHLRLSEWRMAADPCA